MEKENQIEECRQVMRNIGLYKYVRMGAISALLALQEWRIFPKKPKVLKEKRMTAKQVNDMITATIVENCLNDNFFLECFIQGEEMCIRWKPKTEKGKEYHHLEIIPQRRA